MPHVTRSAEVPYTALQMYTLVSDVESYPEFIPWLRGVRVLSKEGEAVVAEFRIGYGPVSAAFTSRAEFHPPERIDLRLMQGLFSKFEGNWRFEARPEGGSRIHFDLEFEFAGGRLARLLRPVFSGQVGTIVNAFVERAGERCGKAPSGDTASPS